jgi:hypothetical protein
MGFVRHNLSVGLRHVVQKKFPTPQIFNAPAVGSACFGAGELAVSDPAPPKKDKGVPNMEGGVMHLEGCCKM